MRKMREEETEPLFWAYGHAVYAAQGLEQGLMLLLKVIDGERAKSGLKKLNVELDNPRSHKTIGRLFDEVLGIEYLTEAEKKIIWSAVKTRNVLVHSYWRGKYVRAMLTVDGRKWLIDDLLRKKDLCRKADDIVESLINQYLSKYGYTVGSISSSLVDALWENENEPPDDLLQ